MQTNDHVDSIHEVENTDGFPTTIEEVFELLKKDDPYNRHPFFEKDMHPAVRQMRDLEEESSKETGAYLRDVAGAYEKGIERNRWLLEERWKDNPSVNWAFKEWNRIIEEEGKEKVIEMHLNPRRHQEILSCSPFSVVHLL